MSKSDAFELDILKLIFNATSISGLADNTATSPNTNLYVSLHTADPTDAGNQASNEVNYTGYARVPVARSTAGWVVSQTGGATSVSPAATVSFPQGSGGSGTATFWAVGTAASGAGKILYSGAISPTIATGAGVTPQLSTTTNVTED